MQHCKICNSPQWLHKSHIVNLKTKSLAIGFGHIPENAEQDPSVNTRVVREGGEGAAVVVADLLLEATAVEDDVNLKPNPNLTQLFNQQIR